jgi:hypothetical protein
MYDSLTPSSACICFIARINMAEKSASLDLLEAMPNLWHRYVSDSQFGVAFFFQDPMDAHPHSCDIECLNRQGNNIHIIIMCPKHTTAKTGVVAMEMALKEGRQDWIPSFFEDLESPKVFRNTRRDKKQSCGVSGEMPAY